MIERRLTENDLPVGKHWIVFELVGIVKGSTLIGEYRPGDVLGDAVRALHCTDEIRRCFQHRMKAHEVRTLHGGVIDHLNGVLVGRMAALGTLLAGIVE